MPDILSHFIVERTPLGGLDSFLVPVTTEASAHSEDSIVNIIAVYAKLVVFMPIAHKHHYVDFAISKLLHFTVDAILFLVIPTFRCCTTC